MADISNLYSTYDELREALRPPNGYISLQPTSQAIWVYTIPRFPDNHNSLLSLSLQKKLDEMNPSEFVHYVLKELTLEERESLMVDERQRMKTFLVNWPRENEQGLSGTIMARYGFYYLNDVDRVQCVFCRGCLRGWKCGDDVLTEHAAAFSFCRFMKGLECGNRDYRSEKLAKDDMTNLTAYPHCHTSTSSPVAKATSKEYDCEKLGISTNRAGAIQQAPSASRIKTFATWPAKCSIKCETLCEAGFYYTGIGDQVKCFYCSGGIREWRDNDDPWMEHARWFPNCLFLLQAKGESYIEEVHRTTPDNKKLVRKNEVKRKQHIKKKEIQAIEEATFDICLRLGHSAEVVVQCVQRNSKPFEDIADLIEAIHNYESSHEEITESSNNINGGLQIVPTAATNHRLDASTWFEHMQRAGTSSFDQGCKVCENKTGKYVPANRIGLPCGHLIFCADCAKDSNAKACSSPLNQVVCPYHCCNSRLTGTMKVFFA